MIVRRKKEAAPCSLYGAVTASFKLDQNNYLTQFILQTRFVTNLSLNLLKRPKNGRFHFLYWEVIAL